MEVAGGGGHAAIGLLPVAADDGSPGVDELASVVVQAVSFGAVVPESSCIAGSNGMWLAPEA